MQSEANSDLGVVSNIVLNFAKNGIAPSHSSSAGFNELYSNRNNNDILGLLNENPTQLINNAFSFAVSNPFGDILDIQNTHIPLESLEQTPKPVLPSSNDFHFFNPCGSGFKRTSNSNVSNTGISKKLKFDTVVKSLNSHAETMGYLNDMFKIINRLDNEILCLKNKNNALEQKNLTMYNNQATLNINITNLQSENQQLNNKYSSLLELNTKTALEVERLNIKSNEIVMNEHAIQTPNRLYSELFEMNNNKVSKPLQDIIKVVTDNEDDKRKREKNLLIFGLKVDKNEKHFITVKKLLNDIGIDNKCVHEAFYLNSTSDHAPIKLVTKDSYSKNLILKASRHLKQINLQNNTKISISMDLSLIDRQIHKDLIGNRNELNSKLQINSDHYYGIRNNNVVKINKKKL